MQESRSPDSIAHEPKMSPSIPLGCTRPVRRASPWCLEQFLHLLERFSILRADWGIVAPGIRPLQSTDHRARDAEWSATVAGLAYEVPLLRGLGVTAQAGPK